MILLLLAAGRGSRMEGYTDNINKCLLIVNDFPIIYYSLKIAETLPITKAIIVVGYQAEKVIEYINLGTWPFPIEFVFQNEQKGIVHAMQKAFPLLNEDVLLNLSDEILIKGNINSMIDSFYKDKPDFICGVMHNCSVKKIQKAYSITLNEDGKITKVLEKPEFPQNSICGTGYCIFKHDILKYLHSVPLNVIRNQYELCDYINLLIQKNKTGYPYNVGEELININTIDDLNIIKDKFRKNSTKVSEL